MRHLVSVATLVDDLIVETKFGADNAALGRMVTPSADLQLRDNIIHRQLSQAIELIYYLLNATIPNIHTDWASHTSRRTPLYGSHYRLLNFAGRVST